MMCWFDLRVAGMAAGVFGTGAITRLSVGPKVLRVDRYRSWKSITACDGPAVVSGREGTAEKSD
jgi:hypothetical protein